MKGWMWEFNDSWMHFSIETLSRRMNGIGGIGGTGAAAHRHFRLDNPVLLGLF